MTFSVQSDFLTTYNDVHAVHAAGGGQGADPVGYQGAPSHRQQRLGRADQVSEPPASVGSHIPVEPGPVPGGEDHGLHLKTQLQERTFTREPR